MEKAAAELSSIERSISLFGEFGASFTHPKRGLSPLKETGLMFDPAQPCNTPSTPLDRHFSAFTKEIIGQWREFDTPNGPQRLVYVDWTASGRGFRGVEDAIADILGSCGNSHSTHSFVGRFSTELYHQAHSIIRNHVHALDGDVVLTHGTGTTGVVNKFQRMLGLRSDTHLPTKDRPVVAITHMEHHSNHTSWLESVAEVVIIEPDSDGLPNLDHLNSIAKNAHNSGQPFYASVTAASNVTGILTPVHEMAAIAHQHGGWIFVDYAASAPYVSIDMHPSDPSRSLDAIFFSPHKFLGGPGSAGVMVFNSSLYRGGRPVNIGGGVVRWTNPWGEYAYIDDIQAREDAGTPGILQACRAALAIGVKDAMHVEDMSARKHQLLHTALGRMDEIDGITVLAREHSDRLGIISFIFQEIPYGLATQLLSDRYGIQARDGCSCAGTYGHYLFSIDRASSKKITTQIDQGDSSVKPGWVRISIHPTMTNAELDHVMQAIAEIARFGRIWQSDYRYDRSSNTWRHFNHTPVLPDLSGWLRSREA